MSAESKLIVDQVGAWLAQGNKRDCVHLVDQAMMHNAYDVALRLAQARVDIERLKGEVAALKQELVDRGCCDVLRAGI